jgi:hypothetical protein
MFRAVWSLAAAQKWAHLAKKVLTTPFLSLFLALVVARASAGASDVTAKIADAERLVREVAEGRHEANVSLLVRDELSLLATCRKPRKVSTTYFSDGKRRHDMKLDCESGDSICAVLLGPRKSKRTLSFRHCS